MTHCSENNIDVLIPSKPNRKIQRNHDEYMYRYIDLVENVFLYLKRWREIATRYAKNASSFLAVFHIRSLDLWAGISWRHHLGDDEQVLRNITWFIARPLRNKLKWYSHNWPALRAKKIECGSYTRDHWRYLIFGGSKIMLGEMKICLSSTPKEELEKRHDETHDSQIRDRIKAILLPLRMMGSKNDCANIKNSWSDSTSPWFLKIG